MYGHRRTKRRNKPPFVAAQLNKRVQIRTSTQTETDDGGLGQTFTTVRTTWMKVSPVRPGKYRRWSSTEALDSVTHEFTARRGSLDILSGINFIKHEHFLFMEKYSHIKGRLFRVQRMMDIDEEHELILILVEEIEERGTGMPG